MSLTIYLCDPCNLRLKFQWLALSPLLFQPTKLRKTAPRIYRDAPDVGIFANCCGNWALDFICASIVSRKVKCEPWETFRDRHGDRGRDLVLFLGRRVCGLKLKELAREAGLAESPEWR